MLLLRICMYQNVKIWKTKVPLTEFESLFARSKSSEHDTAPISLLNQIHAGEKGQELCWPINRLSIKYAHTKGLVVNTQKKRAASSEKAR